MEEELNTDVQISNAYITIFLKSLNVSKAISVHTFLNALIGFAYASKRLLNVAQSLGILTLEQAEEIEKQLADIAKNPTSDMEIVNILSNFLKKESESG